MTASSDSNEPGAMPSTASGHNEDDHDRVQLEKTACASQLVHSHDEEFAAFYLQSVPLLVAFLRWQGASVPDAADCAQETMVQAYLRWSTIDRRNAWCRAVAVRAWLNLRERSSREQLVANPGADLLLPSTVSFETAEEHHTMALLNRLPFQQRQVMAWTYAGARPNEIADALKISPASVRSALRQARRTLREMIGKESAAE